jgi:beta-lactamase class D
MRHIPLLFAALVLLTLLCPTVASAAPCQTGDPFPYKTPARIGSEKVDPSIDCPGDIQSWMNRVNACAHFSGEPPYDKEREDFINAKLSENKCDVLKCDTQALLDANEGDIIYFGIIAEYLESVYGDVKDMPECKPTPAKQTCLLIRDLESGKTMQQEGNCEQRTSPMSTFKIPLALMGFDAGILKDEHNPAWPYKEGYQVNKDNDRLTTDPTSWEANSVVWYSQKITGELGPQKFQEYVTALNYGNMDLSGDKGKNNGLTRAWLVSSLEVSPLEQTEFLRKFLKREFEYSTKAYEMTAGVIPKFETANGWKVSGKTGSGWLRAQDGTPDRSHPLGWFVGWAEKEGRKVVFAKRVIDDKPSDKPLSLSVRDSFLREFPELTGE